MTGAPVSLPFTDLQALFDIAVGSMNFTSGFLDSDEVAVLRRVAVAIGVDPMVGTPREFATQFPHDYKEEDYRNHKSEWIRKAQLGKCDWCARPDAEHPDRLTRRS